jgi:hypothetical protein
LNKKVKTIKQKQLMRKSYLIIAAVATSFLASCANEKVLNERQDGNEQQALIGFSSYSEKSTKAGDTNNMSNLEFFHNTFAVYGTKQSTVDGAIQYVFGGKAEAAGTQDGVTCTYTDDSNPFHGSNWKYEDERFWDKQANYNFIAYAPAAASNPLRYSYVSADALVGGSGNDFVATDYVLTGKNLQAKATSAAIYKGFNVSGSDLDLMTSQAQAQDGTDHKQVPLVFKHILSKLNVVVGKAQSLDNSTVKINSIEITGLKDKGSYSEKKYVKNDTESTSGWTANETNSNAAYILSYTTSDGEPALPDTKGTANTIDPLYFIESLVIPQAVGDTPKLTLKYTITTGTYSENYNYNMDLKDAFDSFFDRCSYTLTFTINPTVITFDASVTNWDENSTKDITIE